MNQNNKKYHSVAAQVAERKRTHPEEFCPQAQCLWRTGGGHCPRHNHSDALRPGSQDYWEVSHDGKQWRPWPTTELLPLDTYEYSRVHRVSP